MTSRHMVCPINRARSIIILSRVSATLQRWRQSSKVASQMGYCALRPKQEEMILDFVRWSDIFVSLPTGSGKLLCYSLLPGVFDEICCLQSVSIVIVVSPLVALMREQARAMTERNIRTIYVGVAGDDATVDEICEGKFQLVLMYMLWRHVIIAFQRATSTCRK